MNKFDQLVDQCILEFVQGKTIQKILSEHPREAERLQPLLESAAALIALSPPSARLSAVQNGKRQMLDAYHAGSFPQPVSNSIFIRYIQQRSRSLLLDRRVGMKILTRVVVVFAILVLAGGLVAGVSASSSSLPGDTLYGVKRRWEQIRLSFTTDAAAKTELLQSFEQERQRELSALISIGRSARVEIQGRLEKLRKESWQVNGYQLSVTPATLVIGSPAVGQTVQILVEVQKDGSLILLQAAIPLQDIPIVEQTQAATRLPTYFTIPAFQITASALTRTAGYPASGEYQRTLTAAPPWAATRMPGEIPTVQIPTWVIPTAGIPARTSQPPSIPTYSVPTLPPLPTYPPQPTYSMPTPKPPSVPTYVIPTLPPIVLPTMPAMPTYHPKP